MNRSKTGRVQITGEARAVFTGVAQKCTCHNAAVVVLTFALAFAVATRFTDYSSLVPHSTRSVAQYDLGSKRQHIDKSSFTWMFSLAACPLLELPPIEPRVALPQVRFSKFVYSEQLYNRPPPVIS